jgi:DNA-binding response OmpR family regulator
MKMSVLIVEDDLRIAALVAKNLEAAGFACHQIHDGETAVRRIGDLSPDLAILDIMLPGIDGLELTRLIRRDRNIPIMLLTARSSDVDKVLGLEIGADDYLTKPFSTRELVARVRALLRRSGAPQEQRLRRGELEIDPARRTVTRGAEPVGLTSLEFDLLYYMAARPGRVFTREDLMTQVWGEDRIVDDRSIDSLISRLRKKLEVDAARPRFVQTVWGAGYRFAETDS